MKRRLAQFILILISSYFIGSLVFLNFFLTKLINNDEIAIHYGFAYSLWPGRVQVSKLNFRIQDSNIQLYFEMPHVVVNVAILPLFRREFETHYINAKDLNFYLRFRKEQKELAHVSMKALPVIPGLPSIEKVPDVPSTGPFNPWKIDLKGIHIQKLAEFWFEEFRYRGGISIDGGFYLYPKTRLEIYPSRLGFQDGVVSIEDETVLKKLTGSIDASISLLDPKKIPGLEIFNSATGKIHLDTELGGLGFINYYLKSVPQVKFSGGAGKAELRLSIDKGQFEPPSSVLIHSEKMEVQLWKQTAIGKGTVSWHASEARGSELDVKLSNYRLFPKDHPQFDIRGGLCEVRLQSMDRRINAPLNDIRWGLDITAAKMNDLRYWNLFIPESTNLRFLSGSAVVSAHINSRTGDLLSDEGRLDADASNAQLEFSKMKYSGKVKVEAFFEKSNISKGDFSLPKLKVSAIAMNTNEIKDPTKGVRDWNLDADMSQAHFNLGEFPEISTGVRVQATNAVPFLTLAGSESNGLVGLASKALPLTNLDVKASFFANKKTLSLSDVSLDSKNASILGWLRKDARKGFEMRLLLKAEPIAVGFEEINGHSVIRLQEAEKWFHKLSKKE